MKNNNRLLLILKYLTEFTDEDHFASIADINTYLSEFQLDGNRDTISDSIRELQAVGYDIICVRRTQNQYYMNSRPFDLAEVKLLVDAIQSSRFVSKQRSKEIVEKLAGLIGHHKGDILKRHLYIESRFKSDSVYIIEFVDQIQKAITENKKVCFQYYDYNASKEKVLRHNGQTYTVSPYVLLWNNDLYYMVGFSDTRKTISKFRVDRMYSLTISDDKREKQPAGFKVSEFFSQEFSMMNGVPCEVELLCDNKLMSSIIDRFGKAVKTEIVDNEHFKVTVTVDLTNMFFGWVFASGGAMKIISPNEAVDGFQKVLNDYSYEGGTDE